MDMMVLSNWSDRPYHSDVHAFLHDTVMFMAFLHDTVIFMVFLHDTVMVMAFLHDTVMFMVALSRERQC